MLYRVLSICFLAAFTAASINEAAAQTPPTNMQLFLLMGQSNMAGRGEITEQDLITHPRIWMLTQDNRWVPARDPVHYDRSFAGVGLASQFARDLAAAEPSTNIGLIPTAVGGSTIAEWAPGTTYYNNAVARTRAAVANGSLAGILWHQGESNSNTSGASIYLARFAELMGRLRADLNAMQVPVVIGQLGLFRTEHAALNPTLAKIPERVPRTSFATAEGLTHKGDNLHFDTPSLYEFGHRYILEWATVRTWLNFEAERLAFQLSGGSRALASHVEASEGGHTLFQPSSFGQYVQFTLPDVPAGTYVVKLRFHRHPDRGRFKVSIDGVAIGGENDQYSKYTYSSEPTLGTVTFASAGQRLIRVIASSSSTTSKQLSVDAIVLVPQGATTPEPTPPKPGTFEAETLAVTRTGGTATLHSEPGASGGRWMKFFPTSFGQSSDFTVTGVQAGTYTVRFLYKGDPDRGRCTVRVDGVQLGAEVDQYQSYSEFRGTTLGSLSFATAGSHTFRVTSSSSSRTSKNLSIDAFVLEPQSTQTLEGETIPRTLSGGTTSSSLDSRASGGQWLKYYPSAFGQSISFTLANIPAGTYEIRYRYKRDPDRGRCIVRVDAAPAGAEIDQYSSSSDFHEAVLGTFSWTTSASHVVQLTSSSSRGTSKNLSIDAFYVVPR
jgi:hypothetical protein